MLGLSTLIHVPYYCRPSVSKVTCTAAAGRWAAGVLGLLMMRLVRLLPTHGSALVYLKRVVFKQLTSTSRLSRYRNSPNFD